MNTYCRTWAKWRERNTGHYNEAIRYARGGHLDRVPEIVHGDCVIEFALRRIDEPVPFWEPVTHSWEDFKAAIERATHG